MTALFEQAELDGRSPEAVARGFVTNALAWLGRLP